MKEFVENTMPYLEEYHRRSNSESGFAADKKMFVWNVSQRRDDRIDNALFCTEPGTISSTWADHRIVSHILPKALWDNIISGTVPCSLLSSRD